MEKELIISMPLYLVLAKQKNEKAKKYYLNLNQYRNWHYLVSNNLKKKYAEVVIEKLPANFVFTKPIDLTFTLWKKDKRRGDRANPLSVHEKFFCDALVHAKAIPDDNDNFIQSTHYYTGGIDKENPRVEIKIKECPE